MRPAPTCPARSLLTAGLMLGVYTILEVDEAGLGLAQTLGSARVALALSRRSSPARPGSPTR
jgi:hypothetical protein